MVVTSPCTVAIRARAALTSGAAAEAAARAKWSSWKASVAADQLRFFPLAAETHGTLGAELWQFLYARDPRRRNGPLQLRRLPGAQRTSGSDGTGRGQRRRR